MFDHVPFESPTWRSPAVPWRPCSIELEIEQTTSTPSFSVWGNFALTQTDEEHPIAGRVHIAFIAPTPLTSIASGRPASTPGFTDDGPAGPRRVYADDYYAAFLKDPAGNSFEAVHRDGARPKGSIDHVAIRVNDVEAST